MFTVIKKEYLPEIRKTVEDIRNIINDDNAISNMTQSTGLCRIIEDILSKHPQRNVLINHISDLVDMWPGRSGNLAYPIQIKDGTVGAAMLFRKSTPHERFSATTAQGKRRRELLDWLETICSRDADISPWAMSPMRMTYPMHKADALGALRVALTNIRHNDDKPEINNYSGICSLVPDTLRNLLRIIFKYWPHYSGSAAFPIPSPDENMSPAGAFSYAYADFASFNAATPYGDLRWGLLEFTIHMIDLAAIKESFFEQFDRYIAKWAKAGEYDPDNLGDFYRFFDAIQDMSTKSSSHYSLYAFIRHTHHRSGEALQFMKQWESVKRLRAEITKEIEREF